MNRHSTLLSLLLLLGACDKDGTSDSVDPAERSASAPDHGHRWLSKLDADKDGAVSREEAKDHPRLAEHFDELDADKDGKLTEAELAAAKGRHGKGWHGKDPAERAAKMMAKLDADKDGAVTRAEAKDHPRLAERFDELDADKDGKLTEAELAAMKGPHGGGWRGKDPAEHAAKMMAKLDANGDGALVPAEVEGKPHLAEHFAAADRDGDGKLTQDELAAFVAAAHERGGKHGGPGGKRGGGHDCEHDDGEHPCEPGCEHDGAK